MQPGHVIFVHVSPNVPEWRQLLGHVCSLDKSARRILLRACGNMVVWPMLAAMTATRRPCFGTSDLVLVLR